MKHPSRLRGGLLVVLLVGCSSSDVVRLRPDPYAAFNENAKDQSVYVEYQGGHMINAQHVMVRRDSTSFQESSSGQWKNVPNQWIKRLVVKRRGLGLIEGAAVGGLLGIGAGGVWASTRPGSHDDWGVLLYAALGWGVGTGVGGIFGLIGGHVDEYVFENPPVRAVPGGI